MSPSASDDNNMSEMEINSKKFSDVEDADPKEEDENAKSYEKTMQKTRRTIIETERTQSAEERKFKDVTITRISSAYGARGDMTGNILCFKCRQTGHKKQDCPKLNREKWERNR